ncbi:hypothetical protein [Parafrankia elaeagni]|uniref:hypothetical protein n=1 Tax=Parafrankia elaeagni TaxID=222534 RepID=UPI0012B646DC|nr:hypothetical protein [Parafrankia elaeagni]
MTLILNYSLGDVISVVTSDTRRVLNFLDQRLETLPDGDNKAVRLTFYTMYAGGGKTKLVDEIKRRLSDKLSPDDDLNACRNCLTKVIEDMKSIKEFEMKMRKEEDVQVIITGFYEDCKTGIVAYNPGMEEPIIKKYDSFKEDLQVIAPSTDHMETILKTAEHKPVEDILELPNSIVSYLATIQFLHYKINPDDVSEKCNYTILFRDPDNRLNFYEGQVDMSDWE